MWKKNRPDFLLVGELYIYLKARGTLTNIFFALVVVNFGLEIFGVSFLWDERSLISLLHPILRFPKYLYIHT